MDKQDMIFAAVFLISLSVLAYLVGVSITGYVTQSMYCDEGACKNFCKATVDCESGEICCDKEDFGVCEPSSECSAEYTFNPELDVDISEIPMPSPPEKNDVLFYSILTFIVVVLGLSYLLRKKNKR